MPNRKGDINYVVLGLILLVFAVVLLILFYTGQFEKITNILVRVEEQVLAGTP